MLRRYMLIPSRQRYRHAEFTFQIFCERPSQLLLGWEAKRELQDMANDLWRWQHQNPEGYQPSL